MNSFWDFMSRFWRSKQKPANKEADILSKASGLRVWGFRFGFRVSGFEASASNLGSLGGSTNLIFFSGCVLG